eukprot:363883-Chlamydomonas_euryale.AAC.7
MSDRPDAVASLSNSSCLVSAFSKCTGPLSSARYAGPAWQANRASERDTGAQAYNLIGSASADFEVGVAPRRPTRAA